ncbi:MAG: hypothetical protein AABX89_00100 [Candidatus Thermoplasmatota archaeon]
MARTDSDQVIGIVLLVLGVLIAVGILGFGGLLVLFGAVAAIVLGVLVLAGKSRGSTAYGVTLVALGVAVLAFRFLFSALATVANIAAGILLIVLGVLKLQRRR